MPISTNQTNSNYRGLFDILISSAIFGAIPAATLISGGVANPFLFVGFWNLGNVCISIIYLWARHRDLLRLPMRQKILNEHLRFKPIWGDSRSNPKIPSIFNIFNSRSILILVRNARFLLFAWSLKYIHPTVAAVFFEMWPIFFIIIFSRTSNSEHSFSRRTFILTILTFGATTLIVLSNTVNSVSAVSFDGEYIFGLLLLAIVLVLILQNSGLLNQATRIAQSHFSNLEDIAREKKKLGIRMFLNLTNSFTAALIGFIGFGILRVLNVFQDLNGSVSLRGAILTLILGGSLSFFGLLFSARGSFVGKDLRVHAVRYSTPVFAVVFLLILYPFRNSLFKSINQISDILSLNWAWFIAGLFGVVSLNTIINFKHEEKRFGLTSLVIALQVFGVIVFFRDNLDWWSDNIERLDLQVGDYYAFVAAGATIFALLLTFEINAIQERTNREEGIIFSLLQRLKVCFPKDIEILDSLNDLKEATDVKRIEEDYAEIIKKLNAKREEPQISGESIRYIDNTIIKLNTLAYSYSKQRGRGIVTVVVINLLALFLVSLTIALKPSSTSELALAMFDIFAFLFGTIFTYLCFHLLDLYHGRTEAIIVGGGQWTELKQGNETSEQHNQKIEPASIKFPKSGSRAESTVAILLTVIIVVVYSILYFIKWLG